MRGLNMPQMQALNFFKTFFLQLGILHYFVSLIFAKLLERIIFIWCFILLFFFETALHDWFLYLQTFPASS